MMTQKISMLSQIILSLLLITPYFPARLCLLFLSQRPLLSCDLISFSILNPSISLVPPLCYFFFFSPILNSPKSSWDPLTSSDGHYLCPWVTQRAWRSSSTMSGSPQQVEKGFTREVLPRPQSPGQLQIMLLCWREDLLYDCWRSTRGGWNTWAAHRNNTALGFLSNFKQTGQILNSYNRMIIFFFLSPSSYSYSSELRH